VFIDSEVLDGQSYTLEDNGDAGGAATATLDIHIQTGADSFDGSSLVISENISKAFLGLDIAVLNEGVDTTIIGTTGSDRISGSAGDDMITGGQGADTMTGDSGADTFIFTEDDSGITSATYDSISDWTVADDLIDLGGIAGTVSNYGEQLATGAAVASAVASAETALAADTDLEFYFITNGTDGFLMWDTDGDQTVDVVVRLVGANALSSFSAANIVDSGG
jgi:Ca2+-binding RTX toxin-like protein